MAFYLDLFRYSELFRNLFRRELDTKYKGTVLGVAWTLINPLVLMGVYTLVFSVLWRATSIRHYPLFLLSGLSVWIFFQSSLQMASLSLLGRANLVKQVRFPRQLLPLAVVGANLITYALMLVIVSALNFALIPATRTTIWAVIPLSLPLIALTSGLAITVAGVTVLFRDVEHLITTVLLPWFFVTPVFYELRTLPGLSGHPVVGDIVHWGNFVTPVLESIRGPLFYGRYAGTSDIVYSAVVGVVALACGAFVFSRIDDQLAVQL
jgi:ABC-type polysaccharide/polyol phosphate export permease